MRPVSYTHLDVYKRQVVAYEKAGDYQSAKEKLDSYLKANPDDKKALKEQEFLNTQISEGDQQ